MATCIFDFQSEFLASQIDPFCFQPTDSSANYVYHFVPLSSHYSIKRRLHENRKTLADFSAEWSLANGAQNEDVSSRHYVNYEPLNCLAERWDFLDDAIYACDAATPIYPTNMAISPNLLEPVKHAEL